MLDLRKLSVEEAEHVFLAQLANFKEEVITAGRNLHALNGIHMSYLQQKGVQEALDSHPYFWAPITLALSTGYFMAIARIFDKGSEYSVGRLLGVASNNMEIFKKDRHELRLRRAEKNLPDEMNGLVATRLARIYEADNGDLGALRKHVKRLRAMYEDTHDVIRNKWLAHREATPEQIRKDFACVDYVEQEHLVSNLSKVQKVLSDLFEEGKRSTVEDVDYLTDTHYLVRNNVQSFFSRLMPQEGAWSNGG